MPGSPSRVALPPGNLGKGNHMQPRARCLLLDRIYLSSPAHSSTRNKQLGLHQSKLGMWGRTLLRWRATFGGSSSTQLVRMPSRGVSQYSRQQCMQHSTWAMPVPHGTWATKQLRGIGVGHTEGTVHVLDRRHCWVIWLADWSSCPSPSDRQAWNRGKIGVSAGMFQTRGGERGSGKNPPPPLWTLAKRARGKCP